MPPKGDNKKPSALPKKASSKRGKSKRGGSAAASTSTGPTIVTKLDDNDVLMGRGAMATDYEGNLRLRAIVQSRHVEFTSCTDRKRKQEIAQEIVHTVKSRGGRFLQGAETIQGIDPSTLPRYEAAWFVVEDNPVLIAKVKQLFRDTKPPPNSSPPMRPNEASQQSQVLYTPAAPPPQASAAMHAPGFNFLWQPSIVPQIVSIRRVNSGPPSSGHSFVAPPPPQRARPADGSQAAADSSPVNEMASRSSNVDQQQRHAGTTAATTETTSMLGQDNAHAVYQALAAANVPQMSLSLASLGGVQPPPAPPQTSSSVPPSSSSISRPGAERSGVDHDMSALTGHLLAANQRREREHNLANALLLQLLPQVSTVSVPPAVTVVRHTPGAPPAPVPLPGGQQDPSMAWLFQQLHAQNQQSSTAAVPAAPLPGDEGAAAAPQAIVYSDLNALLRGEQAAPFLQQPARTTVDLERLLVPANQWRLATTAAGAAPPSAPQNSDNPPAGNPEDGLATFLRSLQQRQNYPSQPPPPPP